MTLIVFLVLLPSIVGVMQGNSDDGRGSFDQEPEEPAAPIVIKTAKYDS